MSNDLEEMGPVDYVVVAFPDTKRMNGEGFAQLVDLVDRGLVRILDLLFVRKEPDGSVVALEVADLDGDGQLDLAVLEGASSGLIGQDELDDAAEILDPGSAAGIVIYENVWAAPLATAVRRSGGQLVASGRIPIQALLAALDATEPADA